MQRALVSIVLVVVLVGAARSLGAAGGGGGPGDTADIGAQERAAGLTFDPSVAPRDREWILSAIGRARPEAQRLIAEVDGLITMRTSPQLEGAAGVTHSEVRGDRMRFEIDFNLQGLNGDRVIDRDVVVLHELGHAIDFALVPEDVNATLEAGIPRTGSCGQDAMGTFGSCTEPAERFADTFAKWALRGRVSAVGAGYGVATPASLETWGAPLAVLAARR